MNPCCQMNSVSKAFLPITLRAILRTVSGDPPCTMPVIRASVSTSTTILLCGKACRPRAGRMSPDDFHGRLAQPQLQPLRPHRHIAFGYATRCGCRPLKRGVPVGCAHHYLGAIPALQQCGALIMVAMGMADDHILNVAGIEAKLG